MWIERPGAKRFFDDARLGVEGALADFECGHSCAVVMWGENDDDQGN